MTQELLIYMQWQWYEIVKCKQFIQTKKYKHTCFLLVTLPSDISASSFILPSHNPHNLFPLLLILLIFLLIQMPLISLLLPPNNLIFPQSSYLKDTFFTSGSITTARLGGLSDIYVVALVCMRRWGTLEFLVTIKGSKPRGSRSICLVRRVDGGWNYEILVSPDLTVTVRCIPVHGDLLERREVTGL